MDTVSGYRFAASHSDARKLMAFYAAMFSVGPVLDVGAGRGYFLEALSERGIEGIGVDISPEAVREARRLGMELIEQDAFTYLSSATGLAGVFVSHVVEHLAPDRAQKLFQVANSALQPGGSIVIVTPNPRDWRTLSEVFWLDPTHVRPYPRLLVEAMLEAAGFATEASGLGPTSPGRRATLATILNRIRFGREYGKSESWVRARRRA